MSTRVLEWMFVEFAKYACTFRVESNVQKHRQRLNQSQDPRTTVPPSGYAFTTLRKMREDPGNYRLRFDQEEDRNIWVIQVEPKFAIGQRAYLIQTTTGNILWDMVGYLDQAAVDKVRHTKIVSGLSLIHGHRRSTNSVVLNSSSSLIHTSTPTG